jgi:hypothetical protein
MSTAKNKTLNTKTAAKSAAVFLFPAIQASVFTLISIYPSPFSALASDSDENVWKNT